MIEKLKKIIEMLDRNKIKYIEKDNKIVIDYPFLLSDRINLIVEIKSKDEESYISDAGLFYRTYGIIESKILDFFSKNNIEFKENELYYKLSSKFVYFDIEKFVKCLIKADFLKNGEIK